MPIRCPLTIPDLSRDEFGKLDYRLMKFAFDSHNEIGRLAVETIYQVDFWERLRATGFDAHREVSIEVSFESFLKIYKMDTALCEGGIYELKTVASILPKHEGQLRNYLMMLELEHGKIINFRNESVESRFVNCATKTVDRRAFSVTSETWEGGAELKSLMLAILSDWGVGLELALYQQAITHLLSNQADILQPLALSRNSVRLGTQKFIIAAPGESVAITSLSKATNEYAISLRKLLRLSPLRAIHWINLGSKNVAFSTIKT